MLIVSHTTLRFIRLDLFASFIGPHRSCQHENDIKQILNDQSGIIGFIFVMPEFIDDRNTGVGGGSLSIQGLSSQGFRFLRCSNVVKHLGEVVADSPYSDDETCARCLKISEKVSFTLRAKQFYILSSLKTPKISQFCEVLKN